jgi:hypothetical protein
VSETYGVGVHDDIPEPTYHALPGLSSTGIKTLLESPAKYRYVQDNPAAPKKVFDLGHAVHELVLGVGMGLHVIDAEEWRTKAVKEEVAAVRESGMVPVKPSEFAQAKAMCESLLAHDDARALLEAPGRREVSALADAAEVRLRGRFDLLLDAGVLGDVKTARTADPRQMPRYAAGMGWHVQAADYRLIARLLGLGDLPFVHLVVETTPPYLTAVYRLDEPALADGLWLVEHAIETYERCVTTDTWPGYPGGLLPLALPRWYSADNETDLFEETA